MLANGKHCSLLRTHVNYGRKKSYNIGHRSSNEELTLKYSTRNESERNETVIRFRCGPMRNETHVVTTLFNSFSSSMTLRQNKLDRFCLQQLNKLESLSMALRLLDSTIE
jgi:hypothetical protein